VLFNLIQNAEHLHQTSGTFMGVVVDNNDPKKLERVKCSIPGLIEGNNNLLPWFNLRKGVNFGSLTNSQIQCIPDIGSKVVIEFQDNDVYSGEIIGCWDDSATHESSLDDNYPNTYGFKDVKGNIFKINKSTGEIKITHNAGTQVIIHPDGHIELGVEASEFICMGTKLKTYINDQIKATYDGHTHPPAQTAALAAALAPPIPPMVPIGIGPPNEKITAATEADIASEQHKVGN
jgi:hypothetical protein